jgi:hypothetical protein
VILNVEAIVNDTQPDPEEELLSALLGSRSRYLDNPISFDMDPQWDEYRGATICFKSRR